MTANLSSRYAKMMLASSLAMFSSFGMANDISRFYNPFTHDAIPKSEDSLGSGVDCYEILSRTHAPSGVYTIAPENAPKDVYCDMESFGGGWSLIHSFGSRPVSWFAYQGSGIQGRKSLRNAGFDYVLSHVNYPKYRVEKDSLQFFKSEAERGYIEAELPSFGSTVKIEMHTKGFNGWARAYVNNHRVATLKQSSSSTVIYASYKQGDKLKIEEDGMVWVKAIWIR